MMRIAVVGAGISGLATAWSISRRAPNAKVVVFEASDRVGGKVLSEVTPEGYLCEWGVNGFLDKVPRTLELSREAGLAPMSADAAAKKRFVFSEGEMHKLPEKPPEFLKSRLLSLKGKLRVAGEAFIPPGSSEDETLAAFGSRRLGEEAFEKLIDPMASGVFAGDARAMSLKSCFPRIHEIETEYKSLIRGLISLQREARKSGARDKPGPGPGGLLTSFHDGMSELTDALAMQLGECIRTSTPVRGVNRESDRFQIDLGQGRNEEFDRLVMACPAWVQAELLESLDPAFAEQMRRIPYPPVAVVCLGYDLERLDTVPEGFGFLVPSREERGILGCVFDSNVFAGRAPEGKVLLRSLVGGYRSPQLAEQPESVLIDSVRGELAALAGIRVEPEFARAWVHQRAIPQYLVGHAERLQAIEMARSRFPGLIITGNAFRGVSLNDCVSNADRAASDALA